MNNITNQEALYNFISSKLNENSFGVEFRTDLFNSDDIKYYYTDGFGQRHRFIPVMISDVLGDSLNIPDSNSTMNSVAIQYDLMVDDNFNSGVSEITKKEFENVQYNDSIYAIKEFQSKLLAKYHPLGTPYLYMGGDDSNVEIEINDTISPKAFYLNIIPYNNDKETLITQLDSSDEDLLYSVTKSTTSIQFNYSSTNFIEIPYELNTGISLIIYHDGTSWHITDGINTSSVVSAFVPTSASKLIIGNTTGFEGLIKNISIGVDTITSFDFDNIETETDDYPIILNNWYNKNSISNSGDLTATITISNCILWSLDGNAIFSFGTLNPISDKRLVDGEVFYQLFEQEISIAISNDVLFGNNFEYFIDDIQVYPVGRSHTLGTNIGSGQYISDNYSKNIVEESTREHTMSFYYIPTKQLTNLLKHVVSGSVEQNKQYKLTVQYPFFKVLYNVLVDSGGTNPNINTLSTFTVTLKRNDDINVEPPVEVYHTAYFDGLIGAVPSSIESQQVLDGESVEAFANPTKTNYTFAGWSPSISSLLYADQTFTAQWTAITYTATFDTDGGIPSTYASQSVLQGSTVSIPGYPTKEGYTLIGWSPAISTAITEDTSFVAQWTLEVTHTVTFNSNGGTPTFDSQTVIEGETATNPGNPSRVGYTFDGWRPSLSTTINEDTIFIAQWTAITYEASFTGLVGATPSSYSTQTISYGGTATSPGTPEKVGYIFDGWSPSFEVLTDDQIYTATWQAKTQVTGSFTGLENAIPSSIASQTVYSGETITKPSDPTKLNYIFDGWSPSLPRTITTDTVFTAQWNVTATFGGLTGATPSSISSQEVSVGSTVIAPTNPTKTGYTFDGWSPSITTVLTENTLFTATWTQITYTASFAGLTGATPSSYDSQTVNYGDSATNPGSPTKPGYIFTGWSPSTFSALYNNQVYTAQWSVLQTDTPSIVNVACYNDSGTYSLEWAVTNNDDDTATLKSEVDDDTPDINSESVASGSTGSTHSLNGVTSNATYTIYATAQASGDAVSEYDSYSKQISLCSII